MRTSMQRVRGGPLLGLAALLALIPVVHAAGSHRYSIHGSLEAATPEKTTAAAPLGLSARLSASASDASLQSGGDFVVMAKLAESPLGCSGSDTIFANGFDPLM